MHFLKRGYFERFCNFTKKATIEIGWHDDFLIRNFAFGRLQSSLPKALESLFDPPSTPPDFIEIGYSKVSYDTFLD
jgi:hypothetical protein